MSYHKKSRSRASAKLALRQPKTTVSHTLQTAGFSSFSINTETLNTQQRMIAFNSSIAVHYADRWSLIELIYICRCDWRLWLLHHSFIGDCIARHLGYRFTCFMSTKKTECLFCCAKVQSNYLCFSLHLNCLLQITFLRYENHLI